ncbi:VP10 [Colorado tick fever virus]|uniref:Microtubule-associated protein VP10 n=1 Tax=Colorado tick fever virus (strain USA/Florio N-7180) TaxID=648168 RepID=VP10_CTFVL|nr:VP10 [Colorado tick fever virus]Q9ENK7.1 RecName: Full=Microtubule-associated protein VP10 [Colorado tick fever virus Florio N-7180]AAG00074.1 VP10 [Colorado tick fever virus]
MLKRPAYYNIFLLPTGRRLAKTYNILENLITLPKTDWKLYETIEQKLKWMIQEYRSDWRDRLSHHERYGMKVRLTYRSESERTKLEEKITDLVISHGKKASTVHFCTRESYKGRVRANQILILLEPEGLGEVEGLTVRAEGNWMSLVTHCLFILGSTLTCFGFVDPARGCRFNLLPYIKTLHPNDKWLLDLQASWRLEYGVSRSIEEGALYDFFAESHTLYAVRTWPGCEKYLGALEAFVGRLAVLPAQVLTSKEHDFQSKLMSKAKKTGFHYLYYLVSFTMKTSLTDRIVKEALATVKVFSFVVGRDHLPAVGVYSGEDFSKQFLSMAVGTMDTPSRYAITIVSGMQVDVDVKSVTGIASFKDGTQHTIVDEILLQPARLVLLGRKGGGKSRLSKIFSELGYNVLDSDTYGKVLTLVADRGEDGLDDALKKFVRLTPDERKAVPSIFETEMDRLCEVFGSRGLRPYAQRCQQQAGRLHWELYAAFQEFYDRTIRVITPDKFRFAYFAELERGGFDDNGLTFSPELKTVVFVHSMPELFEAMGGCVAEIVPTHSTRLAILLRGQGLSVNAELHLHDFYVALNQNGARKVSLGWLVHALNELLKMR